MPQNSPLSKLRTAVEWDRKLAGVFKTMLKGRPDGTKGEKARKDFAALREHFVDAAFCKMLEALFTDCSQPPEQRRQRDADEMLGCIRELRDRGFVETVAVLFGAWCDVLGNLNFERVLANVPTVACLEAWMKVAKVTTLEIEKKLLLDPGATYATVGADWLMECAKPEQLLPLLELFLSRQPRPAYLRPWSDALVAALKGDKRGVLLAAVLRHPWPTEERIAALAEVVRSNRTLLRTTVDTLPWLLAQKDAPSVAAGFVDEIFRAVVTTEGTDREFMTAALARLGTGILLSERRGPQSEATLAMTQSTRRQLRNLTRDEALQARTWILRNLSQTPEPTDGRLHVTAEGARHLALAFEKAAQGFAAKDILTATARNLGLSPIGKAGETVPFNPLRHEDLDGGLVPGDSVRIEEAGWAIKQDALIRAKVRRTQGGSYV